MVKLKNSYLLALLTCLFVLSPVFAEDATNQDDSGDTPQNRVQFYPISDSIDLVTKTRYDYNKPRVVVKSVYPELQSDDETDTSIDDFDSTVLNLVQKNIQDFTNQAKLNLSTLDMPRKNKINNYLYIDYDTSSIKTDDGYVISIRFNTQGFLAGLAHPYHVHRVLNYDLSSNQVLDLRDLFNDDANYLQRLSEYTSNELGRHLKDKSMITQGTAPTDGNFQNWNIKPTGILFTFDEGQVAPYVYGAQTVLVPFSALKDILAPDSVISGCIDHKSRCKQNNVLTGGFLDEAANQYHDVLKTQLRRV
jgi:hypothetical protein